MLFVSVTVRTINGTLKNTLDYTTGRVGVPSFLRAGRQCAQTCTDANETLSTTGSHVGKMAALPVQEELSSYLTAAWQAHGAAHLDGRQTRTFIRFPKHRALTRPCSLAACFCVRRPSRLLPASGVRISRFLPACARRKQAQHMPCPSRTRGFVFGRCRCAPPADALGWASVLSLIHI